MAKYDLTGSLEDKFTFTIGSKEFEFRKPTVREMREVSKKFSGIEAETDVEVQTQKSDEAMSELYKFVIPVGHDEIEGQGIELLQRDLAILGFVHIGETKLFQQVADDPPHGRKVIDDKKLHFGVRHIVDLRSTWVRVNPGWHA